MNISPNITRRALLALTGPLALLPLAGCDKPADADTPTDGTTPQTGGTELLVPSDHSAVAGNAAWCAPMQICWDMFLDEYNNGEPTDSAGLPAIVSELNDASFDTMCLRDDYYVSYAGPATMDAKSEIEALIDKRFDQKSDILDQLSWADDPAVAAFLFYAMLYRQFTFTEPFDTLDPAPFGTEEGGNLTENVAYFGADGNSEPGLLSQVNPYFWESDERYAVSILCETDDLLILARGAQGSTFDEMWNDIENTYFSFEGRIEVASFACPKLEIDVLSHYTDLEGLTVPTASGDIDLQAALQTLKFKLDETGGTIKSEAAMMAGSSFNPALPVPHDFRFDDSFVLFLVDSLADGFYPYAGILINSMEDFS